MVSSLHDILASFIKNNATLCLLQLEAPLIYRIAGNKVENKFVASKEDFESVLEELFPQNQIEKYNANPDADYILEDVLINEDDIGRFLLTLQRQRGQTAIAIRKTQRDASLLFDLLKLAVENRASDLHIRENKYVRLRIDSLLVETDVMTDTYFINKALEQMLPPGKLEIYQEKGDFDFAWEEEGVGRFRVNLHRQRGKAALTMRHVKGRAPTVKEVHLPEILEDISEAPNGIIFLTGTTGSGKSTTMAAMLDHINNTMEKHVITIEDPIEYTFQDNLSFFEQREVGLDAESFDSALVHALRQDPDIIMVGEMRNRETFETALAAAETGHLVMTTLHTKTAPQSVSRILDMFPMEERDTVRRSLSETVRAIICQRLAPRATGKGVVPVNEILINTPIVRKLMFDNKLDKLPQAIDAGQEDGMMSFNQCLLKLVNNGDITEDVALEFSDNPQALKMNLKGIFLSEGAGIIN